MRGFVGFRLSLRYRRNSDPRENESKCVGRLPMYSSGREKENPLVPRITPQQRDLEFVYLPSRSGEMLKVLDLAF